MDWYFCSEEAIILYHKKIHMSRHIYATASLQKFQSFKKTKKYQPKYIYLINTIICNIISEKFRKWKWQTINTASVQSARLHFFIIDELNNCTKSYKVFSNPTTHKNHSRVTTKTKSEKIKTGKASDNKRSFWSSQYLFSV